jgi:hypothetical protein
MTNSKVLTLRIVISWALVCVPLAWGILQTVLKSLPLFT